MKLNVKLFLRMKKLEGKDYLCVIDGSSIEDPNRPVFFEKYGKKDEAFYEDLVRSFQPLIREYECTGTIHTLEYNSFDDIERNREEFSFIGNFQKIFMDSANYIDVIKTAYGKYRLTYGGYHRAYVAKKYGLKLLVHVSGEEVLVK